MAVELAGRRVLPPGVVVAFAAAAAVAGALAVVRPQYGVALVIAAVLTLVVARDTATLPLFLVFVMFVEAVALGPGLQVGRLAGAMAIVVLALVMLRRGLNGLPLSPLLATVGLFATWMVASAFWASSARQVATTLISFVLSASYMLTIAVLVRRRRDLTAIFATLTVGSAIFGVVAFATYSASASGRSQGLVGDPNFFAVYQLLAFAPALALAAGERDARRRLALYGVVAVIVLSVVSSLSRGGLIALGVLVVATVALPWRLFFHRRGRKAAYVGVLVLAGLVAGFAGSARFVQRAQTIFSPSDKGSGRTDLWAAALHGWHDHPLLGLGAGNFYTRSLDLLQTTPGVCTSCAYAQSNRYAHNAYLELLTELGPIGIALFCAILVLAGRAYVVAFRRARAAGERQLERYSIALLLSLLAFCVTAIFLSNQLAKGLWLLVGLALALDAMTRRLPAAAPAAAADYHPPVTQGRTDDHERQVDRRRQALADDQRRLDRRRAALDERERSLAEREQALRALAPDALVADRQELARQRGELEALRAQLAEQEERLRRREGSIVAELESTLAQQQELARLHEQAIRRATAEAGEQAEQLRARAQRLVEQEQELERRAVELRAEQADVERQRSEAAALSSSLAERERRVAETLAREEELLEVQERLVDQSAVELAQEQARLQALERKLQERAAELERRERALEEAGAAAEAGASAAEERAEYERLRRAVERRAAEVTQAALETRRERAALEQERQDLEARQRTLAERENAAAAEREALARELQRQREQLEAERGELARLRRQPAAGAVAPEPPVAAPAGPPAAPRPPSGGDLLEPEPGVWNLDALEAAIGRHRASFPPERIEEWQAYLVALRPQGAPSGDLPSSLDSLVWEVYGDLIGRDRG